MLYALLSNELYRLLVIERHWSTTEIADFIDKTAGSYLFPESKKPRSKQA